MNIWISSDFHYGHVNISGAASSRWKSGYRTFDSVHEMNKTLTETINKYVKEDDILYHLGDFCFGHQKTPIYRQSLNVKTIHLIRGNHDTHIDLYSDQFTSIQDVLSVEHGVTKLFLSHYSHRIWPKSHRGAIHLYGHSHGSIEDFNKSMDVGVDVAYKMFGEWRPFHLDEIVEIMSKRIIVPVDHHVS